MRLRCRAKRARIRPRASMKPSTKWCWSAPPGTYSCSSTSRSASRISARRRAAASTVSTRKALRPKTWRKAWLSHGLRNQSRVSSPMRAARSASQVTGAVRGWWIPSRSRAADRVFLSTSVAWVSGDGRLAWKRRPLFTGRLTTALVQWSLQGIRTASSSGSASSSSPSRSGVGSGIASARKRLAQRERAEKSGASETRCRGIPLRPRLRTTPRAVRNPPKTMTGTRLLPLADIMSLPGTIASMWQFDPEYGHTARTDTHATRELGMYARPVTRYGSKVRARPIPTVGGSR